MKNQSLAARLRLGLVVFAVLMALEIAEYVLGTAIKSGGWLVLAPMAIIACWPIVRYYMHINQIRHPEE